MTRRIWDPGRGPGDTNARPSVSVRPLGPFFPRPRIGFCDLLEQGEDASHKPSLPLPALVGWMMGGALSAVKPGDGFGSKSIAWDTAKM